MNVKLIIPASLSVIFGIGLGMIPFVNEHLHWSVFYVIPISGLLFGFGAGFIQSWLCYVLNVPIRGIHLLLMTFAAVLGYVATDFGIYLFFNIEGSFFHFFVSLRLDSAWAVISHAVDLLGCVVAAGGVMVGFRELHPFCDRCSQFKRRSTKHEIKFVHDKQLVEEIFQQLSSKDGDNDYKGMIEYIQQLAKTHQANKGDVKIVADQRYCVQCRDATSLGRVFVKDGSREWDEVENLRWVLDSKPGEYVEFSV